MTINVYREIADSFTAYQNCVKDSKREWKLTHKLRVEQLVSEHMPSGAGFDDGTKFDFDKSTPEKLVFYTSFHHMNDYGSYDGWTDHVVTVTPSFIGVNIRISGRNRKDIKEYICDVFANLAAKEDHIPNPEITEHMAARELRKL